MTAPTHTPADPWAGYPVPPMRLEAQHGDRLVRCFTPRPASVWAMFEQSALQAPQAEAMVFEGRRWSYAELAAQATQLAGQLAAQGLQPGARVVMLMARPGPCSRTPTGTAIAPSRCRASKTSKDRKSVV